MPETLTVPVEIESGFEQLRRRAASMGKGAICATLAVATLVMMIAFAAGKANATQTMLFMMPIPAQSPQTPVVSAKEILTGASSVENHIGTPMMEAEAQKQVQDSLSMYDACDSYCCRRNMLAKAVGAAALVVGMPALAADTKMVLAGVDGKLAFEPKEITVCKGDSVTWKNNVLGPHNVIFDDDAIPSGADSEKLSTPEYLQGEGETFTATFTIEGSYSYYCVPHRGGGMVGKVAVSA